MLEYLKNCWKSVSEHAKIFWKHALECSKIVFEKVEKSWTKYMRRLVTWKVKKKHVAQNKDCFCGYSFTKKTFLKSKNHGVDKAAVATAEFKICAIVTPSWAKVGYFSVCDGLYSAPLRLCPIIGDVSSEARHLSLGHLLSFRRTVVRLHNLATKNSNFLLIRLIFQPNCNLILQLSCDLLQTEKKVGISVKVHTVMQQKESKCPEL